MILISVISFDTIFVEVGIVSNHGNGKYYPSLNFVGPDIFDYAVIG